MNTKRTNPLLVLFLAFFIGLACNTPKDARAQIMEKTPSLAPKEKALLWEISGKDVKKVSYLYGTIHMIGAEDFFLTPDTKKAFGEAEQVAFEINMEDMTNMGAQMSLLMGAMMKDGLSLKDLISEEDYKFVDTYFKEIGLPLFLLERLKPMLLTTFASGDMSPGDLSSGKMKSYEMEFMEMAKSGEKPMMGLETVEFQLSMFDSIPYKVQANMLVETLKAGDTGNDEFQDMVELYKNQDISGMLTMFEGEEAEGGLGDYEDLLLNSRNRNWIPIMGATMKEKQTFFAVGAGHLGGESGVIALLRKAGYTLKPVTTAAKK
ncbi:MAG: TraB/GumN family protein [Saprospiraceae bacterium]